MSDSGTDRSSHLHAVEAGSAQATARTSDEPTSPPTLSSSEAQPAPRATRSDVGVSLILAIALALCMLFLAREWRESRNLAAEVSVLSEELEAARSEILTHRTRMVQVREVVEELSSRMGQLQTILGPPAP